MVSKKVKVIGMVTRCAIYQEYDKMLTIISPEAGKIEAIARSCRRPKSKIAAAAQPFIYGEFILNEKSGRYSLSQADIREAFYDLRLDLTSLSVASRIVEICNSAIRQDENCEELFKLMYYALSFLCYADVDQMDLFVCFIAKFLKTEGFAPASTRCGNCGKSTFEEAKFNEQLGAICNDCGRKYKGVRIEPLALEALRRMILLPVEEMNRVKLPKEVCDQLYAALRAYYRVHMEREIKTLGGLYGEQMQ